MLLTQAAAPSLSASARSFGPLLLVLALLVVAGLAMARQSAVDIAFPLRDWLNARDARRLARDPAAPQEVRRTYWSVREYRRDSLRLHALGYLVTEELLSPPFVEAPYVAEAYTTRSGVRRPPPRRRVPVARLLYQRRAQSR